MFTNSTIFTGSPKASFNTRCVNEQITTVENWATIFLELRWGLMHLRIISPSYGESGGYLSSNFHFSLIELWAALHKDWLSSPSPEIPLSQRSREIWVFENIYHSFRGTQKWGVASTLSMPLAILPSANAGKSSVPASPSHDLRRSNCILISALWGWFIIDEIFLTEVDTQYCISSKLSNLLCDGYFLSHLFFLGFNYFVSDNKAHHVLLIKWGKHQFPHCFLVKYIK